MGGHACAALHPKPLSLPHGTDGFRLPAADVARQHDHQLRAFQAADSLRWLSHTAYRTKELSLTFQGHGFGRDERKYWEEDAAWQGFRELMEKLLTAWDWGECFVALNLVAKPAVEEATLRILGESARIMAIRCLA